jgi:hypothetical protein
MPETQEAFYRLAPHLIDTSVSNDGRIEYAGRRFVFFHSKMFATLFENMEEVTGPVIHQQIQKFGFKAGKEIASKMDAEFRDIGVVDILTLLLKSRFSILDILRIAPANDRAQIEKIFGYGRRVGWIGAIDILVYETGHAKFRFKNETFEAFSYGKTGKKECKFSTGVVKGLCAYYWDNDDLEVVHEKCHCTDDTGITVIKSK